MKHPASVRLSRPRPRRRALHWAAAVAQLLAVASFGASWSFAQPAPAQGPAQAPHARELLNSERIERTFGSYGIEVLHSDAELRISNLYSDTDGRRVGRTFAVVSYPRDVDPLFAEEHREILAGGSIGAVFARNGWTVTKEHRYFGKLSTAGLGQNARVAELMRLDTGQPLAVHVYVLHVSRDAASFEYAAIAEVHHPDYLRLDALASIYGEGATTEPDRDPLVDRMLAATMAAMR